MLQCVIADDEELARKRIVQLLARHQRRVQIVKEFSDGKGVVDYVNNNKVDVLFLDIEMPNSKGTDIIKEINLSTAVVFTTAYKEFALEAFEDDAVDYLLKPISQERFDKAMLKVLNGRSKDDTAEAESWQNIVVKIGDKHRFVPKGDVVYISSSGKYSEVFTRNENSYLLPDSITSLAERLDGFVRIHRSIIVNPLFIAEIRNYFNSKYKIVLKDKAGTVLVSGRTYAQEIKSLLTW